MAFVPAAAGGAGECKGIGMVKCRQEEIYIMPIILTSSLFIVPAIAALVRGRFVDAIIASALCTTSIVNHAKLMSSHVSQSRVHQVDVVLAHFVCVWYLMGSLYGYFNAPIKWPYFLVSFNLGVAAVLAYRKSVRSADAYKNKQMTVHVLTCTAWIFYLVGC